MQDKNGPITKWTEKNTLKNEKTNFTQVIKLRKGLVRSAKGNEFRWTEQKQKSWPCEHHVFVVLISLFQALPDKTGQIYLLMEKQQPHKKCF